MSDPYDDYEGPGDRTNRLNRPEEVANWDARRYMRLQLERERAEFLRAVRELRPEPAKNTDAIEEAQTKRRADARLRRVKILERVRSIYQWIKNLETLEQRVAAQRTMLHVHRVFSFVQLFVPRRVANEEIGDALELIEEHFKRSHKRWPAYVKMVTTIVWIAINTVRFVVGGSGVKKMSGGE